MGRRPGARAPGRVTVAARLPCPEGGHAGLTECRDRLSAGVPLAGVAFSAGSPRLAEIRPARPRSARHPCALPPASIRHPPVHGGSAELGRRHPVTVGRRRSSSAAPSTHPAAGPDGTEPPAGQPRRIRPGSRVVPRSSPRRPQGRRTGVMRPEGTGRCGTDRGGDPVQYGVDGDGIETRPRGLPPGRGLGLEMEVQRAPAHGAHVAQRHAVHRLTPGRVSVRGSSARRRPTGCAHCSATTRCSASHGPECAAQRSTPAGESAVGHDGALGVRGRPGRSVPAGTVSGVQPSVPGL